MTLVEVLVAMSITSMLLAALCAVFQASASAVRLNEGRTACAQTARLALNRILADIRTADAVEVDGDGRRLRIIRSADQLAEGEVYRQYAYDADQQCISLQIFLSGLTPAPPCELADHVTACRFAASGSIDDPSTPVVVTLTCAASDVSMSFSGSASARRAYNRGQ